MARQVVDRDISPVLNAASGWIERCLIGDQSLFSDASIWRQTYLLELRKNFIEKPDEGKGKYFEKLKIQIGNCSSEAKRLMAEIVWATRLFPSKTSAATKRRQVTELYSLAGSSIAPEHPMLSDEALKGIGSAGPGYNNHYWRELGFAISIAESLKALPPADRRTKLTDYNAFMTWIASVPQEGHRQFRHMLRFFAFPDTVERMASSRERRKVVGAFRGIDVPENWDDRKLDAEVLAIRREMEAQYPAQVLDFYSPPLRERWIEDDIDDEVESSETERAWLLTWNPRRWQWRDFQQSLEKSARGESVQEEWKCGNSAAKVGDEVWLVRLGAEPRVICGHGRITRDPFDAPHWDVDRRDDGETTQFIGVEFDSLRDPDRSDVVTVEQLVEHTGNAQRWTPQQSGIEIKPSAREVLWALWNGEDVVSPEEAESPIAALAARLTAEHVKKALESIDRDGVPSGAESTRYDLIEGSTRYPPKYVLELAAEHATGQRLNRATFTGGERSTAFRILRKLGFAIEPKAAIEELVAKFLEQAKTSELRIRGYLREYRGLEVKVSFGMGNSARIPWIAFLAEGQRVSQGIYPVLLLFKEQNILLLCYGISETNEPSREWDNVAGRQTVDRWFRGRFGSAPDRYGSSFVLAAYDVAGSIDAADLVRQLDTMIGQYLEITRVAANTSEEVGPSTSSEPLEVRADLSEAVASFGSALQQSRVSFGPRHEDFIRALLASLATKPFVILTGLSGSGKTQVAVRLGEWFGSERLFVAAVRPDWTGSEAVFGYEDALRRADGGRSAWAVPGVLEFMLKAARDPQHPYLLVLDEMNLAHVERYLADVLSGMESRQDCLPNLKKEGDGCWRVPLGERARLPFPRNLWVIGTVNVDETTYMFSPKVLDRANVFEFRVTSDELRADAVKPLRCSPGDPALVRGLHAIASDDHYHLRAQGDIDQLSGQLRDLHRLLSRYGMEFGHRTFYESLRFAGLMRLAGVESIDHVLDLILIQKILPRLHGARRRLEAPLLALAHFARDVPSDVPADDKLIEMKPDSLPNDVVARLPISHDKVSRMLRALRANQFASFTE